MLGQNFVSCSIPGDTSAEPPSLPLCLTFSLAQKILLGPEQEKVASFD